MSYKVLIVEDSSELLEIMCDFYREEGAGLWEVDTASVTEPQIIILA